MKILFHPLNAPDGQKFNDEHASNLLKLKNNGGWYEKKSENKKDVIDAGTTKGKVKKSET